MTADRKKNAHAGHRGRMRARFLSGGLETFEQHEVLELLLFEFIPVVNTNPIGHALIERFGSVKNVLTAPYDELVNVPGIGPKAAEGILSVFPILSNDICAWFRRAGALVRYDLVFLADWFMDWTADGSVGLVICGQDRRFRDFMRLNVKPGSPLFDLGSRIIHAANGLCYYLIVKNDFNLVTRENARVLRHITGCGNAYLLDVLVMEGCRLTSVFYMR